MSSLVSIILPTYNVAKYLNQCLDSVVNQTYGNIEVIVVIDGATDGSYDIAKRYEQADKRVKVIYQENQGSGPARNNGINHANGEFIIFVDPDDYVDNDMVQVLMNIEKKEKVDFVISGYATFYNNSNRAGSSTDFQYELSGNTQGTRAKYLSYLSKGLLGAPTRKLYKTEIIKCYGVEFPDLRRSQDIVFNYRYYDHITSVCLSDRVFYHYRIDEGEYNLKLKKDYYKALGMIFEEIMELCRKWGIEYSKEEYTSFANFLFPSVVANIEANLHRKEDIKDLVCDPSIRSICKMSHGKRLDQKLLRKAILTKNLGLVKLMVGLRKAAKGLNK